VPVTGNYFVINNTDIVNSSAYIYISHTYENEITNYHTKAGATAVVFTAFQR